MKTKVWDDFFIIIIYKFPIRLFILLQFSCFHFYSQRRLTLCTKNFIDENCLEFITASTNFLFFLLSLTNCYLTVNSYTHSYTLLSYVNVYSYSIDVRLVE